MTRFTSTPLALLTALALLGACDSPAEVDAGGGGTDAGPIGDVDAGPDDMDAGSDAGPAQVDAGPIATDAGPAVDAQVDVGDCTPAEVTIVNGCPAFTPCGGDIVGDWCYSGICIEESEIISASVREMCSGIEITEVDGEVTGRVAFDGTNVSRDIITHVEATIDVPCVVPPFFTCMDAQDTINDGLGSMGSATCVAGSDPLCVCTVVFDSSIDTEDPYTVSGTSVTVGSRTFDYCRDDTGPSVSFQDISGSAQEPGTQTVVPAT